MFSLFSFHYFPISSSQGSRSARRAAARTEPAPLFGPPRGESTIRVLAVLFSNFLFYSSTIVKHKNCARRFRASVFQRPTCLPFLGSFLGFRGSERRTALDIHGFIRSADRMLFYKTLGMWFTLSLFLQFRVLKIPLFSEKIGNFSRIFQEKYCTLWIF